MSFDTLVTPEEATKLTSLSRSRGLRALECALVVAVCEGPRRINLFKLRWSDLDLRHGVMHLRDVKATRDKIVQWE